MLKQVAGAFTVMIGTGFGDSENLILPIVIILIGIALIVSGKDGTQ